MSKKVERVLWVVKPLNLIPTNYLQCYYVMVFISSIKQSYLMVYILNKNIYLLDKASKSAKMEKKNQTIKGNVNFGHKVT